MLNFQHDLTTSEKNRISVLEQNSKFHFIIILAKNVRLNLAELNCELMRLPRQKYHHIHLLIDHVRDNATIQIEGERTR